MYWSISANSIKESQFHHSNPSFFKVDTAIGIKLDDFLGIKLIYVLQGF